MPNATVPACVLLSAQPFAYASVQRIWVESLCRANNHPGGRYAEGARPLRERTAPSNCRPHRRRCSNALDARRQEEQQCESCASARHSTGPATHTRASAQAHEITQELFLHRIKGTEATSGEKATADRSQPGNAAERSAALKHLWVCGNPSGIDGLGSRRMTSALERSG